MSMTDKASRKATVTAMSRSLSVRIVALRARLQIEFPTQLIEADPALVSVRLT